MNGEKEISPEMGTLLIEDTPCTCAETCWRDVYDLELQVGA
jgi:hypothetical protein